MRAHYQGLVTHVDHWFGVFMETLDKLELAKNTAVLLISDHGTNFCENPRKVIGKPSDSMYPSLMRLPLFLKTPEEHAAGTVCHEQVYNFDLTATVYDLAGVASAQRISGQSLYPLCGGRGQWQPREYITCRYANSLCYLDDSTWALGDIDGHLQEVFDVKDDPECRSPLEQKDAEPRWERAWRRLLADAGGEFPDYRGAQKTDALGRR